MANKNRVFNPLNPQKLRLLTFSPQQNLSNPQSKKKPPFNSHETRFLYSVYHNTTIKNTSNPYLKILNDNKKKTNSVLINPQKIKNIHIDFSEKQQMGQKQKNILNCENSIKRNNSSAKVQKNNKSLKSIFYSQNHANQFTAAVFFPQFYNTMNIKQINSSFNHNHYTNSKLQYQTLSEQRKKNIKKFTFLSKTFQNIKKSEAKAKDSLLSTLSKRLEREYKQGQKRQNKNNELKKLQQQKTQNSTQKYMNHLIKYEAKKSLLQRNISQAQQIKQNIKSQESLKSNRQFVRSQQMKQKALLMRKEKASNIQMAKSRTLCLIKQKSNRIRNQMAGIYKNQGNRQTQKIKEIDQKSKFIMATIEKTKRSRDMLKQILHQARDSDSDTLLKIVKTTFSADQFKKQYQGSK